MKMRGDRSGSSTTSTVSPSIARARHHASTNSTARAMWPVSRQSGSNSIESAGIEMYSDSTGRISSHVDSECLRTRSESRATSRMYR